jgi:hypothetical protein
LYVTVELDSGAKPSPTLVADMLQALEAEEGAFEDEELSEEGNPM